MTTAINYIELIENELKGIELTLKLFPDNTFGTLKSIDDRVQITTSLVRKLKEEVNSKPVGSLPRVSDTILISALQRLSCLGNGELPGNSVGNSIAQEALRKYKEIQEFKNE